MDTKIQGALALFSRGVTGAEHVGIERLTRLSGGAIQENWLLQARITGGAQEGELDFVMRTDALSGVSSSHGRAHEFALLTAAFQSGVTVPEPLWLCEDSSVIGRPFFLMRRVGGSASAHQLVKAAAQGKLRAALAGRLGQELARIHTIRPPRSDLGFLPTHAEAPALHTVKRLRGYLDGYPEPRPALEWGLRWLERNAPARGDMVLTHGDYRTGNYMVEDGELTAILDWEFAGWGDPLEDIGWFCAKCWRFGATEREAGGIGARADFYRGYQQVSGRAIDRLQVRYWEVMAHVNWAVIALQQAERHVTGEQPSLLLALTGHIVPELEYQILLMTEE